LINDIIFKVEEGINEIINKFHDTPYHFYSENDFQSEFFHILSEKDLNKPCISKVGRYKKESSILHKKYPTKGRYKRNDNKPSIKKARSRRGYYDVCLWDPTITEKRQFTTTKRKNSQKPFVAVEFNFNLNHHNFQWDVYWDLLKLSDPENEVENGYILLFFRDYPYEKNNFPKNGYLDRVHGMFGKESKVKILYIENNHGESRNYLISDTKFPNIEKYDKKSPN
jgi:hypothetical protein